MPNSSAPRAPELSVITPTYNERENILPLLDVLKKALDGIAWELIVADDSSPDGTADLVLELAKLDANLRCIERQGPRNLSRAAIEGFLLAKAPYVALIDADLQHDETCLPLMLRVLRAGGADIIIGTRYAEGGSGAGFENGVRANLSRLGGLLARGLLHVDVSDPMSGFFAMRRDSFVELLPRLSGQGFKILVDILASSAVPLRIAEMPYVFRPRHAGSSKLDMAAKFDYLHLLFDKAFSREAPARRKARRG